MKTCLGFVIVMATVSWLIGCASVDSNKAAKVTTTSQKGQTAPTGQFAIPGGIAIFDDSPRIFQQAPHTVVLQYNDGEQFYIHEANPTGRLPFGASPAAKIDYDPYD